jgi:hypothetical protein
MEDRQYKVDYKQIKEQVSIKDVLDHFSVAVLGQVGDELRGECPIPQCKGERTFSVNVTKNAFQCFRCKNKGNQIDLALRLLMLKPELWEKGRVCVSFHDAACYLAKHFAVGEPVQSTGGEEHVEPVVGEQAGIKPNKPASFYDFITARYEGERKILLDKIAFLDEGIAIAKALRDSSKSSKRGGRS